MVPLALLHGCATVREALEHDTIGRFLRRALLDELVPATDAPGAEQFARDVLDRFANPFIDHALIDITLQGTMKMRVRIAPSIVRYAARMGRPPASLAVGFAAWLLFMRGDLQDARRRAGEPVPADDQSAAVRSLWSVATASDEHGVARLVASAFADEAVGGAELGSVHGFAAAVTESLTRMLRDGVPSALEAHLAGALV